MLEKSCCANHTPLGCQHPITLTCACFASSSLMFKLCTSMLPQTYWFTINCSVKSTYYICTCAWPCMIMCKWHVTSNCLNTKTSVIDVWATKLHAWIVAYRHWVWYLHIMNSHGVTIKYCIVLLVTGEANFAIPMTSLTVGGFNQPPMSRALIEPPGNAEKGVSQRFLWLFPRLVYSLFKSLEPVNKDFTA